MVVEYMPNNTERLRSKNPERELTVQLDVPFRPQIDPYSCGPAVLQMVLAYFNKEVPQEQLKILLKTVDTNGPMGGTQEKDLVAVAGQLGFMVTAHEQGTIGDIINFLRQRLPVIVGFLKQEPQYAEGHFGVVTGWDHGQLIIHDPFDGQNCRFPAEQFEANWRAESGQVHRWLMVITPVQPSPME